MSANVSDHTQPAAMSGGMPLADRLQQRWTELQQREGSRASLPEWLSLRSGLAWTEMSAWDARLVDHQMVSFAEGQRRLCVALREGEGEAAPLVIVLADPFDRAGRLWVEGRLRAAGNPPSRWFVADAADVAAFYGRLEREMRALDGQGAEFEGSGGGDEDKEALSLSLAAISADDSPVVRFVNSTLYDALKAQASDIHMECSNRGLVVKYRLDGVLQSVIRLDGQEQAGRVISRIKVLADLDITERRLPQDGRLKIKVSGRTVDIRVSIMPNLYGEDAVLRILDRYQLAADDKLSLAHLGFGEDQSRFIRRMGQMPHGLFLVTGPTGSGKTTTLYAVLSEVNTGLDKVITIEDPVEYQLPEVLQIPVNEAKGLTFARGLRSILRHDPDRIMVGEMRDAETAQIAVQAALTGHQVYATVHANNVFDVIGRLATMGVDPYNLVAALNGVLAQRLMRLICRDCITDDQPDAERIADSQLPAGWEQWKFKRGLGCPHCRGTGYKGRRAVSQMLTMDVGLRSLIAERASPAKLREAATERGLTTLRDEALRCVQVGLTTLEEANRVTAVEE
ncbi:MAG: hypothetical protein RL722_73 [Pseudomonadota bacterium]|jgi:general secretion pathway protein E